MNITKLTIAVFTALSALTLQTNAQTGALNKPVNTMIESYLALKNTLAAGDASAAETAAKNLLAAIGAVPQTNMNAQQAAIWPAMLAKLQYDSRHISEVNHIDHQREHFAGLSNNLYTVLKALKANNITLYREYCVMTRQYYLSNSAKDKDPYMGMANCSKVKETLPAVK